MVEGQFVARERELGQLDDFLNRALAGQGQVCFVTGEAGSGKTSLVGTFARRALEQHQDLVVAIGQSDAQTGAGDAYLPFRDVLGQLTGDVEAKLAERSISEENAGRLRKLLHLSGKALTEVGPDLIGIFVPGAGLAARLAAFVAEKAGWMDRLEQLAGRSRESVAAASAGIEQNHILEQYTNVLKKLAEKQPLLLVLDDLQWADSASIDLLFRLGRRIGESRILIVGTYRPAEIALGRLSTSSGQAERHPLDKVLAEFKRYLGQVQVDLDQARESTGRQFVDAFLDNEPNRLGEGFRQALHQHTGGHPLFTIELLRDMQERGVLIQDGEGHWIEGAVLDWAALPARVEGVIEERIGRLEEELREVLTVASVQGEEFAAEIVAQIQSLDARGLVRRLGRELDKEHRLVSAQGIQRLGIQRLSLYRFQHNLIQKYLYSDLDQVERSYLHEDIGTILEQLYASQLDEIAVQLARHFTEAGISEKAATYLRRAGELAAARFAYAEAATYFSQSLELTPETEHTGRYDLLLAREKAYDMQGKRGVQAQDLTALEALADLLSDPQKRAEVALRQSNYAEVTGDYPQAIAAAMTAIEAATAAAPAAPDVSNEAAGYLAWGRALWRLGDYAAAQTRMERALALARSGPFRQLESYSLRNLGLIAQDQSKYAEATSYYEQSRYIAHEIGDRRCEGIVLNNLGNILKFQGDTSKAQSCYEQALQVFGEVGDLFHQSLALSNLAGLFDALGNYTAASTYNEQALRICREIGDRQNEGIVLNNLGSICQNQGDYAGARAYYKQALRIHREIGGRWEENIALKNLGLLFCHLGNYEAAREYSQQALVLAQELGSLYLQGYVWTDLGHILVEQGHLDEAAAAYQQSLQLRRESEEHHLVAEPLAGLARVSLARSNQAQALSQVQEILDYLETRSLDGTEEPLRIYLTCYYVLKANQDPRAQEILHTAHRLLQERATGISDEELRHTFLNGISIHREILDEFLIWSEKRPKTDQ